MVLLQDLPNELLLQILKYLLPDDVDNFSESRKEFQAISSALLPRHERLKSKYTEVTFGWVSDGFYHPLSLIKDICQDSEIVWYVKRLDLDACDDSHDREDEEGWVEAHNIAVDCQDGISKMVQACPYLDSEERERWIGAILACDSSTAIAFLACMFPCLTEINLQDWYDNGDQDNEYLILIRRITQVNESVHGESHAFKNLRSVTAQSSDPERFLDMGPFDLFSALPATIDYYGGSRLRQETEWTPSQQKSAISSLEFHECMFYTKALQSLFGGIANLRKLTYEYYWSGESEADFQSWRRDWQPGEIILSLLQFASHSLVELDLTRSSSREIQREQQILEELRCGIGKREERRIREENLYGRNSNVQDPLPGPVNLFMGSLRGFQVLEYVRVQSEMFVEENAEGSASGRTVHRFVDLMPSSVERVALVGPGLYWKKSSQLVLGLPELKEERVPRLKEVHLETETHVAYNTMEVAFRAAGVECVQLENKRGT